MLASTAFDNGVMPAITGMLLIPKLRAGGTIRFLIDTGASDIFLQPLDGRNIKVPYAALANLYGTGPHGIGATPTDTYSVDAEVIFTDGQYRYAYDVMVDIVNPNSVKLGNPTLLGRSVLHKWKILYEHPSQTLDIEPTQPGRRSIGS